MACGTKSNKINGFDKWDIESAADTLIKAESIRDDKRKGFYETVSKEVVIKAKAADEAAMTANKTVGLTKRAKERRAKG